MHPASLGTGEASVPPGSSPILVVSSPGQPRMRNLLLAVLLACGKCPAVPGQARIHLQTLSLCAQFRFLFKSGNFSPVLRVELLQSQRVGAGELLGSADFFWEALEPVVTFPACAKPMADPGDE